jgi:hypothetical protein
MDEGTENFYFEEEAMLVALLVIVRGGTYSLENDCFCLSNVYTCFAFLPPLFHSDDYQTE